MVCSLTQQHTHRLTIEPSRGSSVQSGARSQSRSVATGINHATTQVNRNVEEGRKPVINWLEHEEGTKEGKSTASIDSSKVWSRLVLTSAPRLQSSDVPSIVLHILNITSWRSPASLMPLTAIAVITPRLPTLIPVLPYRFNQPIGHPPSVC